MVEPVLCESEDAEISPASPVAFELKVERGGSEGGDGKLNSVVKLEGPGERDRHRTVYRVRRIVEESLSECTEITRIRSFAAK